MKKTIERLRIQSGLCAAAIIIDKTEIQIRANTECPGVILHIDSSDDLLPLTVGELRDIGVAMQEMAELLEGQG